MTRALSRKTVYKGTHSHTHSHSNMSTSTKFKYQRFNTASSHMVIDSEGNNGGNDTDDSNSDYSNDGDAK